MERDLGEGGSDVGRDDSRDLGDEPPAAIRDAAPDVLAPIDPDSPVSGHQTPPVTSASATDTPEHDWERARDLIRPAFRPVGTSGLAIESIDRDNLAAHSMQSHAQPLIDQGPAGLPVVYTISAGAFDIVVNGDHLLSWGIDPTELQDAAIRNLASWSAAAPWTDEVSGERRLISSDTGDGLDAVRILLPDVVEHLSRGARGGRPGPCRHPRPAPAQRRDAARRRPGVRSALRRLRGRAIRWRRRADRPPRLRARRRPPRRLRRGRGRLTPSSDGLRVERDGPVVTLTLDRPEALNALTIPLKLALAEALRGRRRRSDRAGGRPDRRRPGVLCRPGPRRARRSRTRAPRRRAARALPPDRPRDARDGPARRRGRERRRRRRRAPRSRSPATCGWPRPKLGSSWRSGASGSSPTAVRRGSCRGSSARREPPRSRSSATRSTPRRRPGSGS